MTVLLVDERPLMTLGPASVPPSPLERFAYASMPFAANFSKATVHCAPAGRRLHMESRGSCMPEFEQIAGDEPVAVATGARARDVDRRQHAAGG